MSTHPVPRGGLVVDLEHAHLVTTALDALSVSFTGPDQDHTLADERLGLALLTQLCERPLSAGDPVPVADLDALLMELRRMLAADRGGWLPLIGKNRPVDGVIRTGTSKPMGNADPVPLPDGLLDAAVLPSAEVGAGVRVGMVDTPLFVHPDFDPARVHAEPAFVPDPAAGPVSPSAGHGTFVASMVLRQAPGVELFARGVLDPATGRGDAWDTAVAIVELGARVHILNLSLACFTADGEPPLIIRRAIERLDPAVVVVAAAGNHGDQIGWQRGRTRHSPAWPAAMPGVTAVGATTADTLAAGFSPQAPWVDCTAVGAEVHGAFLLVPVAVHQLEDSPVTTDQPFDGQAVWSGTSFAAATVSGAIAARMGPGVTARAALDVLLAEQGPDAVVSDLRRVG
jgi:membrane-anchored mycosin MYCP